jgi:hypothetical protein
VVATGTAAAPEAVFVMHDATAGAPKLPLRRAKAS